MMYEKFDNRSYVACCIYIKGMPCMCPDACIAAKRTSLQVHKPCSQYIKHVFKQKWHAESHAKVQGMDRGRGHKEVGHDFLYTTNHTS